MPALARRCRPNVGRGDTKVPGFTHSIVSYPQRGAGGDPRYRGNCAPQFIADYLHTYHANNDGSFDTKHLVIDPMRGSDTTGDVCRTYGIPYQGFDLSDGFDASSDSLLDALNGQHARTAFLHPPYSQMIPYSGCVWGERAHAADLSRMSEEEFEAALQRVLWNVAEATEPMGHYGVLVANWRHQGRYYHLAGRVLALAPDPLEMEVIKVQHNTSSSRIGYSGSFVPTLHEQFLIFKRRHDPTILSFAFAAIERAEATTAITWRNLVKRTVEPGETITPKQLAERISAHPKAANNRHLAEKARQLTQDQNLFKRLEPGVYSAVFRRAA